MNQVKTQIIRKLNTIVELVKHCAAKALPIQDPALMQEVTLAIVTHDGLCKLFEQEGPTANVVSLVNEFGNAVAILYQNMPSEPMPKIVKNNIYFSAPKNNRDKNLLN